MSGRYGPLIGSCCTAVTKVSGVTRTGRKRVVRTSTVRAKEIELDLFSLEKKSTQVDLLPQEEVEHSWKIILFQKIKGSTWNNAQKNAVSFIYVKCHSLRQKNKKYFFQYKIMFWGNSICMFILSLNWERTYPTGHGIQSAIDFAPSTGLYWPAAHDSVLVAPRLQ